MMVTEAGCRPRDACGRWAECVGDTAMRRLLRWGQPVGMGRAGMARQAYRATSLGGLCGLIEASLGVERGSRRLDSVQAKERKGASHDRRMQIDREDGRG